MTETMFYPLQDPLLVEVVLRGEEMSTVRFKESGYDRYGNKVKVGDVRQVPTSDLIDREGK